MLFFGVKTSSLLIITLHFSRYYTLFFHLILPGVNLEKQAGQKEIKNTKIRNVMAHDKWADHWAVHRRHRRILFTQQGDVDVMFLLWILKQEMDKIKMTSCWVEQSLSLLYSDRLLRSHDCSRMQGASAHSAIIWRIVHAPVRECGHVFAQERATYGTGTLIVCHAEGLWCSPQNE